MPRQREISGKPRWSRGLGRGLLSISDQCEAGQHVRLGHIEQDVHESLVWLRLWLLGMSTPPSGEFSGAVPADGFRVLKFFLFWEALYGNDSQWRALGVCLGACICCSYLKKIFMFIYF